MKGLKKNLIYWGYTFERLAAAMLLGIAVYTVMMCLVGGGINPENFVQPILGYLWMFAFISIFINGFTAALSYFPLSISLGSGRKASYTGMQIVQHLIMIQYLAIGAVAYYFFDREAFFRLGGMLLSVIGIFLLLVALTNVTCICTTKFGKIAGMVVYIISLVVIVVFVVIFALSSEGELDAFKEFVLRFAAKPYLFIGALLADAISVGVYYKVMRKQDLQF